MFSSIKTIGFAGALMALVSLAPSIRAGTFEVRNQSNSAYEVAICYYVPGTDGQLADGTSFDAPEPAYWNVQGWYRVDRGQTIKLASGAGDKTYVLMRSVPGANAVSPQKVYGDPITLPVRLNAFNHASTTKGPGVQFLSGFYPYPTNMLFTIR